MLNNTVLFLNRKNVATASLGKCEQMDLVWIQSSLFKMFKRLWFANMQGYVILIQTEKKTGLGWNYTGPASILDDTTYANSAIEPETQHRDREWKLELRCNRNINSMENRNVWNVNRRQIQQIKILSYEFMADRKRLQLRGLIYRHSR